MKKLTLKQLEKFNKAFELKKVNFRTDPDYGEEYIQVKDQNNWSTSCKVTAKKHLKGNQRVYELTYPEWEGELFVGEAYNTKGSEILKQLGFKLKQIK